MDKEKKKKSSKKGEELKQTEEATGGSNFEQANTEAKEESFGGDLSSICIGPME